MTQKHTNTHFSKKVHVSNIQERVLGEEEAPAAETLEARRAARGERSPAAHVQEGVRSVPQAPAQELVGRYI